MRFTSRLAAGLLAALLCSTVLSQAAGPLSPPSLAPAPVAANGTASPAGSAAAAAPSLAELRAQLASIPTITQDDEGVRALVAQLNGIARQAEKFVTSRTSQLADLNARLGELGNPPAAGATPEDRDVTRQRASLLKARNALDADIRLARLLSLDAQQRAGDLLTQRRTLFEARLAERTPSPLGREFWLDLRDAWPDDTARLGTLWQELKAGAALARQPAHRWVVTGTLLASLLIAFLGNWLAEHALVRLAARILPVGRLRRSLLAVAIVITNVVLVGLAAQWLSVTLDVHRVWGPLTHKLAQSAVHASIFIAFVIGLGRALLANPRPSWRLPPIADPVAQRLAPYPWLVALMAALVWAPTQVNELVEASFAAVVATQVATALGLTLLMAALLLRLREPHRRRAARRAKPTLAGSASTGSGPADVPADRPLWVGLLTGCIALALVLIVALVALGYVALAGLLAAQITWGGIVVAAFYVLFKFADDLCMGVVSSRSSFGQRLQKSFGFAPQTLDQSAVVLSGLARVALFFYMLIALVAPLGTGPGEVFQRSGQFGTGLKVGEFQLVPEAIFSAVAVLVIGFIVLRVFKRWLDHKYLPSTALEPGMQSSVITLLGYVGGILVVAFSLSALGIGVERIAWVASALSVGIGFGLQAIVQNFISGLILLAERPVKVGDWVVLGSVEGDVRRINVRATEIQLGDRSTLIVPNSEFITKPVRNMTLANAEGRVLLRLPLPLTTDAHHARDVMLAACRAHTDVLPVPAPSVTLDGVENAVLMFQAIAYVPSPRLAAGVRSDLLIAILDGLKSAGLPLSLPTQTLVLTPTPTPTPPQPEAEPSLKTT